MTVLSYREAGVDIENGSRFVERIKPLAETTHTKHVLGTLGGFAGLCTLPQGIESPVLVSGTDGVGTKLKLAFQLERHDTIGIDLVAMCVNDIITVGAQPLFFLDYFATSKLQVDQAEQVVRGITVGCQQAECALLGGETAELPGFYHKGEYDIAGFAVGVVDRKNILDGKNIIPGDVLIGLASSGLHSNGYSLAQKALFDGAEPLSPYQRMGSKTLADALLHPTRIYTRAAKQAAPHGVKAMCHITGGGLTENIPRVLPPGLGVRLNMGAWPRPVLFDWIQQHGHIEEQEMRSTFNMGLGFTLFTTPDKAEALITTLNGLGEEAFLIGEVIDTVGVSFEES